jgi:hypothetical protein
MPWENYIECADGQCAGAIFLDNGQGAVLGANFMRGNDVVFDLERQRVGFAPADCAYVEAPAGAAAVVPAPAAGAAAAAAVEEEDKDCELTFGAEAGPCDAACPAGQDGVASGEQPFNMEVKAPATGKGKACPPLPLVQKKPCLVTCHADAAAAGAAAADEEAAPCPAEVAWGACTSACEQEGQAQAKQAGGGCGPVTVTRPCAVGAECAAALEGYAVDVLLVLVGVPAGEGRTLSRALQVGGWVGGCLCVID